MVILILQGHNLLQKLLLATFHPLVLIQGYLSRVSYSQVCYITFCILGTFMQLWKATVSFTMSVHPSIHPSFCLHGIAWLLLDRFLWNFVLGFLLKSVETVKFDSDCWCCVPDHFLKFILCYMLTNPPTSCSCLHGFHCQWSVYFHSWNVLQYSETSIHHFPVHCFPAYITFFWPLWISI
jgi:hypothetical protein